IASRAIDCGAARGYGGTETLTATELMMDEIAGELGPPANHFPQTFLHGCPVAEMVPDDIGNLQTRALYVPWGMASLRPGDFSPEHPPAMLEKQFAGRPLPEAGLY